MALVTGGDSGVGGAVCHCFALEGASVAFTYVKPQEEKDASDTLKLLRKSMASDAYKPMCIAADLGQDGNCKKVADEVGKAFGCIDILVNNAAEQWECESVEDIPLNKLKGANIFSQFFMVRCVITSSSLTPTFFFFFFFIT